MERLWPGYLLVAPINGPTAMRSIPFSGRVVTQIVARQKNVRSGSYSAEGTTYPSVYPFARLPDTLSVMWQRSRTVHNSLSPVVLSDRYYCYCRLVISRLSTKVPYHLVQTPSQLIRLIRLRAKIIQRYDSNHNTADKRAAVYI